MAQRIKQMISFKRKCSFIVLISDVNSIVVQLSRQKSKVFIMN